ncbi:bcl-2-related ovarian killer protein [Contarinia nasturtii]|uniref:bcl-2-related ovarian killer protein n=1 Tax=Contarinia nasturtii TaxID=265458 RepID=UPI0012D3A84B|nr:bcl-2-related ovarian killer protein [Contarinia nasturtii]
MDQTTINKAKCLCSQYVRVKLKRAGILNRKVLQRLRYFLDTPTSFDVHEVFPALNMMCEELERMHPRVYMNISRHLSRAPFGELEEAHTAPYLLNAVAKDLFKNGISWAKIISIFTVSGGLAVDIVRQGHYDYLPRLIESTGDIVEDDLVPWLTDNGGWSGLLEHIRPNYYYFDRHFTRSQLFSIATLALFIVYVITFIIRSMISMTNL